MSGLQGLIVDGCCCGCPDTTDAVKAAIIANPLNTYTANFTSQFDGLVHGTGEWVNKSVYNSDPNQSVTACTGNPCGLYPPTWDCPIEAWVINKHSTNDTNPGRLMPWNYENDAFPQLLSCGLIQLGGNHTESTMRPYFCDDDCSPCQGPPSAGCGNYVQGLVDQAYNSISFDSTVGISITDNINQNTLPQVATLWCPPAGLITGVPIPTNIASKKEIFTNSTNPLAIQTVTVKKQIRLYSWKNNFPYPPEGGVVNVEKCLALVFGVYVKAARPWFNVTTNAVLTDSSMPDGDELTHWITYTSYWNGTDTAAQWLAKPLKCSSVSWNYYSCPFGEPGSKQSHYAMPFNESTYMRRSTSSTGVDMHTSGTDPECGIYYDNFPTQIVAGFGCVWSDVENKPFLGAVFSAISGDCNVAMNPIISSFQPNLSAPSTINIT
jgi:hypothetical protein